MPLRISKELCLDILVFSDGQGLEEQHHADHDRNQQIAGKVVIDTA
jgi:hypothetical protein